MNIYQRVTLALGAIAAVVVFLTGAPWKQMQSTIFGNPSAVVAFQVVLLGRLALVLVVTGLVWFALRGARFDTIDWARFRKRTRRVYLILWIGWLVFLLLWVPLKAEYERRDILSKWEQAINRYPELGVLEPEMIRDFETLSVGERLGILKDTGLEPEVRNGLRRLYSFTFEKDYGWVSMVHDPSALPGFAGIYGRFSEQWAIALTVLVLIPAGLYLSPRAIFAVRRWAGWGLKGD
jgi:hypothetical protein